MAPPPFRADQVGSLLRPGYLIAARKPLNESTHKQVEGSADQSAAVQAATQAAVREAVAAQEARGILPVVSGEMERAIFYDKFFQSLHNYRLAPQPLGDWRPGFPTNRAARALGYAERDAGVAVGKVSRAHPAYLDDWLFLRAQLPEARRRDFKVTVPPPGWWHVQMQAPFAPGSGYAGDEELLADVAAALRAELLDLHAAGLRHVQVDDPNLSFFCDEAWVAESAAAGTDLPRLLDLYLAAHNAALRDLPADLCVGLHVCRGNFPGGLHVAEGPYDRIAARLFAGTSYRLFYFEFDSPRAGGFAPLRHLPADKAVVLGLVTTKDAALERKDDLVARVLEAADIVAAGQGRERADALRDCLAVSPQCGFASAHAAGGVGMDKAAQWAKLELVNQVAEELWPGWKDRR